MPAMRPRGAEMIKSSAMTIRFAALLAICAALLTTACGEEAITRSRVPKSEAPPAAVAEAPHEHDHEHEHTAGPRGVRWTLPSGWKETPGTGMRLATFVPPGGVKAEGTVVALPGDSGGELENANRWRGQIGLTPTDAAGLAAARTTFSTKAGPVTVYDFLGTGEKRTRLIAAVVKTGEMTWFFKLTGDEAAAESARGGFISILKGLTPDAPK